MTPRSRLALAAVAGFVVVGVVAVILVAAGVLRSTAADGSSADTAAISLPARIGSFVPFAQVKVNQDAKAKAAVANIADVARNTATDLRGAYGGASAAVQVYADQKLDQLYTVWVVRASTPPPVVQVQDLKFVQLAQQQYRIVRSGASTCEVYATRLTPYGQKPDPADDAVLFCQRSAGALTVIVRGGPSHDVATMAGLVDDVWRSVS